ncbi:hypothetical protein B9Z55_021277 [Caenorhabditis nigoni]|uniref:F-box domain-containing protein n=2 Tax=Caenorhabditis nigoni TaxID=1611254 RepID=A0A2G5TRD0_9PELO|nr:hypothetical protein B9Z55_021277 [Caenorhabditis nigoni]
MSSLSEMPELVLENIIRLSDFRSVLTLRQVCRDFLNFIDDLNDSKLPDSKIEEISINTDGPENICLVYENLDPDLFFRHEFIYSVRKNSRSTYLKTTHLENTNIVDVAVRDLELILKFQKCNLERLCLSFFTFRLPNNSSVHTLAIKLCDMFKELNRTIKTKNLTIQMDDQSKFMLIIPFIDSDTLEDIYLRSIVKKVNINRIVKTEQWKKADKVQCDFFALNMNVEDIFHFSQFTITTFSISAKELDFLRKAITSSSNFYSSRLGNEFIFNESKELSNLWGPAIVSGNSYSPKRTWYFGMKNSKEKVLELISKNFCSRFEIIKLEDVPNGAIVNEYNEN